MLVLTRKYQEKIRIGDNITITVLRTKGKAVRLGIEAPNNVSVIRGELAFEPAEEQAEVSVTLEPVTNRANETMSQMRRTAVPAWKAESTNPDKPQVRMERVSRSKLREILPHFNAGSAPLRAAMNNK